MNNSEKDVIWGSIRDVAVTPATSPEGLVMQLQIEERIES